MSDETIMDPNDPNNPMHEFAPPQDTSMKDSLGYNMLMRIGEFGGSGGITSKGFD